MPNMKQELAAIVSHLILLFTLAGLAVGPLWAQPAAELPLAVSGTLVDERGGPAAGVDVVLRPYPSRFELDLDALGVPDALPAAVDRTRSDAGGSFSVSAPVPGPYRLEISPSPPEAARGAVVPLLYGNLAPLNASRVLEPNELPSRHRVAVRVRDADDQPIEGALVIATPTTLRSARYERTPRRQRPQRLFPWFHRGSARTGAEGIVRFLMPTAETEIVATAPGFAIGKARTETDRVALRLERDPGVRVRVRNPNGTPAPGVLIRTRGESSLPLALTNESGEALVSGILGPRTTFELERADHAFATASPPGRVRGEPPNGERVVHARLETPLLIPGRVVDEASGVPVDNATVWAASFPGHATSSDHAGAFDLSTRASPNRAHLWVHASGYVSARLNASEEHGGRAEVSIHLRPAAPLSGMLMDSAHRPVAGASIQAEPLAAGSRGTRWSQGTASGSNGSFLIPEAEYDRPYRLTVRAAGFPSTVVDAPPLKRDAAVDPLQIVLTRGRRASGNIVDTEGSPVGGAEVRLRRPPENGQRTFFNRLDATEPTTTDEQGGFRFPAVSAGEYEVRIVHSEYLSTGDTKVDVPSGEGDYDLGSFTLVPGAELVGTVSDRDSQPVAGATVQVPRYGADRDQERTATTDIDGTFRLTGLPHDLVDLSIVAEGFAPSSFRGARPGTGEPIHIELQAGATLTGRVVNDAGNPVAGASLELDADTQTLMRIGVGSARDFFQRTGSDGSFRFEHVGAGTWSIEATEGDAKAKLDRIELTEGTERFVELELRARDHLTVLVTTQLGAPLADAEILVMSAADLYSGDFGATDASGRAQIGITPGTVTVHTRHEEYQDDSRKVVLEPGSNQLTIQLRDGGAIAGVVRSADGAPLASATVEAHPKDDLDRLPRYRRLADSGKTISDLEGQFHIAGLEPGTYFVVGRAPSFAADGPARPFAVDGQTVDGVNIVLAPGGSIVGTVTGLSSTELSQVQIEVSQEARWQNAAPDAEGHFVLENLAPGRWKVVARQGESFAGRSIERTAILGPGTSEAFVELPFERGLRLSGQVFVAGEPLIGGSLGAAPSADGEVQWTETDHQGQFAMGGLEPGPYNLTIEQPSGRVEHRSIDLLSDLEGLRIDLQLPASVTGVVLDGTTGQPLAYAWLTAGTARQIAALRSDSPDPGYAGETMSETGGRFEIEFGPGAEQLWVEREGYQDALVTLSVPPGQRQEGLVIRMQPGTSEAPEQ